MSDYTRGAAREDFNRARTREFFQRIINLIAPEQQELLSLDEMRKLIPAKGESYRGLQTVPIDLIVGSEGRYQDFNKRFLPKKEHLRTRWEGIDRAHLTDVILPPIQLYEVGGVYFVRDGNHRVSVGRMQGAKMIDAEVTSLDSDIKITPDMTKQEIIDAIIEYERGKFYSFTKIAEIIPEFDARFTATGRYEELLKHLYEHKYFMNLHVQGEIPFDQAVTSWYNEIYLPIILHVQEEELISIFPGRTESDLYMWLVKHWHYLKEKYGPGVSVRAAVSDFKKLFQQKFWDRLRNFFRGPR